MTEIGRLLVHRRPHEFLARTEPLLTVAASSSRGTGFGPRQMARNLTALRRNLVRVARAAVAGGATPSPDEAAAARRASPVSPEAPESREERYARIARESRADAAERARKHAECRTIHDSVTASMQEWERKETQRRADTVARTTETRQRVVEARARLETQRAERAAAAAAREARYAEAAAAAPAAQPRPALAAPAAPAARAERPPGLARSWSDKGAKAAVGDAAARIEELLARPGDGPIEVRMPVAALEALRDALECPITREPMTAPAVAADGHTYDAKAMSQWLGMGATKSPLTGEPLPDASLERNHTLKHIAAALAEAMRPGRAS